jgi:hypothetical protein
MVAAMSRAARIDAAVREAIPGRIAELKDRRRVGMPDPKPDPSLYGTIRAHVLRIWRRGAS